MKPVDIGTNRNKLLAELLKKGVGSVNHIPTDRLSTLELWATLHDRRGDLGVEELNPDQPFELCV